MHGAGGVGRNEFHVIPLAAAKIGAAILGVGAGGLHHIPIEGRGEVKVQKTGARNFQPLKAAAFQLYLAGNGFGNGPGRFAESTGAGHGQVAGQIAVFRVTGDLYDKIGQLHLRQQPFGHGGGGGLGQQGPGFLHGGLAGIIIGIVLLHGDLPFGLYGLYISFRFLQIFRACPGFSWGKR